MENRTIHIIYTTSVYLDEQYKVHYVLDKHFIFGSGISTLDRLKIKQVAANDEFSPMSSPVDNDTYLNAYVDLLIEALNDPIYINPGDPNVYTWDRGDVCGNVRFKASIDNVPTLAEQHGYVEGYVQCPFESTLEVRDENFNKRVARSGETLYFVRKELSGEPKKIQAKVIPSVSNGQYWTYSPDDPSDDEPIWSGQYTGFFGVDEDNVENAPGNLEYQKYYNVTYFPNPALNSALLNPDLHQALMALFAGTPPSTLTESLSNYSPFELWPNDYHTQTISVTAFGKTETVDIAFLQKNKRTFKQGFKELEKLMDKFMKKLKWYRSMLPVDTSSFFIKPSISQKLEFYSEEDEKSRFYKNFSALDASLGISMGVKIDPLRIPGLYFEVPNTIKIGPYFTGSFSILPSYKGFWEKRFDQGFSDLERTHNAFGIKTPASLKIGFKLEIVPGSDVITFSVDGGAELQIGGNGYYKAYADEVDKVQVRVVLKPLILYIRGTGQITIYFGGNNNGPVTRRGVNENNWTINLFDFTYEEEVTSQQTLIDKEWLLDN